VNRQPDLFANIPDKNAFVAFDREAFRKGHIDRMMQRLAEAEAATTTPWTPERTLVQTRLCYNHALWLPPEVRADVIARYTRALERLGEHAVLAKVQEEVRKRDIRLAEEALPH
jgi:hypothetical protein